MSLFFGMRIGLCKNYFLIELDLWKFGMFSREYRNIDEWFYAHDEVNLELTWGIFKYLHRKIKG